MRFVTFFMAGSMRVPVPRFLGFDFLGCVVSVPVWLTLGTLASRYGENGSTPRWAARARRILFVVVVLIIVLALVTKLRGNRERANANQPGDIPLVLLREVRWKGSPAPTSYTLKVSDSMARHWREWRDLLPSMLEVVHEGRARARDDRAAERVLGDRSNEPGHGSGGSSTNGSSVTSGKLGEQHHHRHER